MTDIVERLQSSKAAEEIELLRARIEAMERQEPVAWMDRNGTLCNTVSHVRASDKPLYLAPGAQPAPSIPEGWRLVPVEPTEVMKHAGRAAGWSNAVAYNETRDIYKAMLAAAPEAKP